MSNETRVEEAKKRRPEETPQAKSVPTPAAPGALPGQGTPPAQGAAAPAKAGVHPGANEKEKGKALFHRPVAVMIAALIVIAGIVFGATVILHVWTHETTDDAFVDGHVVLIAPKISGKVAKVNVRDNQEVKKGQALLEIDPADYDAVVAQKQAALDVAKAKERSAEAAVQQNAANIETMRAGVESLNASMLATQLSTQLSHADLTREQSLIKSGVVSAQDFEHSKSAAQTADATLVSKQKQVDAATAYIDYARAQKASAEAQKTAAEADVNQAQAELDQAKLQQSYAVVTAPEDGRVTSKAVEAGAYVQTGQTLLAIVPHETWVTANYKETQITLMRPGQPVEISVDAYPDRKLKGHVDSIQAGSGARFSLLPPENATGNFVKVVQRVPVKIVFDEQMDVQRALGPGMSAVPDVQVRGSAGPAFVLALLAGVAILGVIAGVMFWLGKIRGEA